MPDFTLQEIDTPVTVLNDMHELIGWETPVNGDLLTIWKHGGNY